MAFNQYQLQLVSQELGDKKRKKPIPFPLSTIEEVKMVGQKYSTPLRKFLFYWLYLTGQRISEALRVRRADITYEERNNTPYLIVNSVTLKNKKQPRRVLPLPFYEPEKPMTEYVFKQIDKKDYEEKIFSIGRGSAWYLLQEHFIRVDAIMPDDSMQTVDMRIYPHYLRHCRASHLAQYKGYELYQLMQFFGWSSPNVASVYATLNWQSLAQQMERGAS